MSPCPGVTLAVFAFGFDSNTGACSPSARQFRLELEGELSSSKGSLIDAFDRRFEHERDRHLRWRIHHIGEALVET